MKRSISDYVQFYQALASKRRKSLERARKQSSIELFAPLEEAAQVFTIDELKNKLIVEYQNIELEELVEYQPLILIESKLDFGNSNIFQTLSYAFRLKRWKWVKPLENITFIYFCTITIGIGLFFGVVVNSNILSTLFCSVFFAFLFTSPLAALYHNCLNVTLKNCRRILLEELRYLFLELESLKLAPSVQIEVLPPDTQLIIRLQIEVTDAFLDQLKTM
ncbi:MAG: hypothetical protein HC820_00385 [Hydrococcus sp. RM1_1_31]|nr:hypothetical protein [Hydrococcus sp. RM1_1_31]